MRNLPGLLWLTYSGLELRELRASYSVGFSYDRDDVDLEREICVCVYVCEGSTTEHSTAKCCEVKLTFLSSSFIHTRSRDLML